VYQEVAIHPACKLLRLHLISMGDRDVLYRTFSAVEKVKVEPFAQP